MYNGIFRYRGYYYDSETGFYYLQSRYYDPEVGRFINADGYASTGQGFLGHNMFAYCGNNPAIYKDGSGSFATLTIPSLGEIIDEIRLAIAGMSSQYATVESFAHADGPAPFGDALMIAGVILITLSAMVEGTYQAARDDEQEKDVATTKKYPRPVLFPENPADFIPLGLIPVVREGTNNGSFITWMDPVTNEMVFRWDENLNYSNGPHYHIAGVEEHYYPNDVVPEPYATIYFPD